MSTRLKPSWEPQVRHGGAVYCSPACGFNCTREEHDRAHREAGELAKRLGDGWTPHVWENMGWHYEAVKGIARIMPVKGRDGVILSYTAYVNSAFGRQVITRGTDPVDAFGMAMQQARTTVQRMEAELNDVSA